MFERSPKEKLLERGVSSLSNAELLEIILSPGVHCKNVPNLAKEVLFLSNGTLSGLARANVHDLTQICGIGHSKAISLVSAFEIGRRKYLEDICLTEPIRKSSQIFELFRDLADLNHETLWVMFLRKNNTLISKKEMSVGGIDGTVVDVRLILKAAVNHYASGIILIHNHPSGNLEPSDQDRLITLKVKEASKLFDICFVDHVIIGPKGYYSFSDDGRL